MAAPVTPDKRPGPKLRPWEQGGEAAPSFGSWLRRQRELREITLREIAESTKISLRYLEALEDDRFDVLPAPIFARGFLREYSKYVGLDADEVVNHYLFALQSASTPEEPGSTGTVAPRRDGGQWLYVLFFLLALAVLVGLVTFAARWSQRRRVEAPPPPPAITAPARLEPPPVAAVAEPPVSSAPLRAALELNAECWIEIHADGEQQLSQIAVQGESFQVEAQEEIVLRLGDASAVTLEVNGEPYPLEASPGEVREVVLRVPETEPVPPPASGAAPRSAAPATATAARPPRAVAPRVAVDSPATSAPLASPVP